AVPRASRWAGWSPPPLGAGRAGPHAPRPGGPPEPPRPAGEQGLGLVLGERLAPAHLLLVPDVGEGDRPARAGQEPAQRERVAVRVRAVVRDDELRRHLVSRRWARVPSPCPPPTRGCPRRRRPGNRATGCPTGTPRGRGRRCRPPPSPSRSCEAGSGARPA